MFQFLYKTYFSYIAFRPVYLTKKKTFAFDDKLDILGFKKTNKKLKLLTKH